MHLWQTIIRKHESFSSQGDCFNLTELTERESDIEINRRGGWSANRGGDGGIRRERAAKQKEKSRNRERSGIGDTEERRGGDGGGRKRKGDRWKDSKRKREELEGLKNKGIVEGLKARLPRSAVC